MLRRDPDRRRDPSRRVRLSLPDDEYIPGESSPRDQDTNSQATSDVSYTREDCPFSSQASGRRVHDIRPGRNRGSFSDDELVSSLSMATGSAYSGTDYSESSYAESSVAESSTRSQSTVQTEPPLRDSRRHLPDISHWESRNEDSNELGYGEEPISVADTVRQAEFLEVRERQKLPEPAARIRKIPKNLTREEYKSYSKLLDHVHKPSEIIEGLYVANFETAHHYLRRDGNKTEGFPEIGYVLSIINFPPKAARLYNALIPKDPKEFPDGTRMMLIVKDSIQVNFMELFPTICTFIARAMKDRRKAGRHAKGILVHCRKGMSRSVAAVMAYLVWAEDRNVIQVWKDVINARKVAWPNAEFWTQLCMWRMWDCELTEEDGSEKYYYSEYVIMKGLTPAMEDVKPEFWEHMGLRRPKYWLVKSLRR